MENLNLVEKEAGSRKHKIIVNASNCEDLFRNEKDVRELKNLADGISSTCKASDEVMVVGGVALRLLEAIVGIDHEGGVITSNDIDLVFIGSDENRRRDIQESLQKNLKSRVDVQRMASPEFRNESIFPQMILLGDNGYEISALKGTVVTHMPLEHFELVEVEIEGKKICLASPAMLWHFYATRSLGDGKKKDWLKNKFNRIRIMRPEIEKKFGLKMQSANELTEWREFRHKVRSNPAARILHVGVDIHDSIGRPLENSGLATLIR